MKRLIYLLLTITILMLTVCVSSAGVLTDPNGDRYIYVEYPDGTQSDRLYLRKDLIGTYEVYGQPEQVFGATPPQLYDDAQGQWRYFGYSKSGITYSNPAFRADSGGFSITERQYIKKPYERVESGCDDIDRYVTDEDWGFIYPQIQQFAILQGYPADALPNDKSYYGAIVSSMQGNRGALKVLFYRRGDSPSNWRYETIPNLIIKMPDYYAQFTGSLPQQFSPGETIELGVKFGQQVNNDFSFLNVPIKVYLIHSGKHELIYSNTLSYGANQRDVVGVSFTVPNAQSVTIRAVINQYEFNGAYGAAERTYDNNMCEITLIGNSTTQPEPTPELNTGNLSVTAVTLIDSNGNVVTKNQLNGQYKIRVAVKNYFNEGGFAQVGVYMNGNRYESYKSVFLEAGGTMEVEWSWPGNGRDTLIMGVVNIVPLAAGAAQPDYPGLPTGWNVYKFNDKYESYYDDNYIINIIAGDDKPSGPPPPGDEVHPARYNRVTLEWQDNWTKIPIIFDDTKYRITTRLIPTPREE